MQVKVLEYILHCEDEELLDVFLLVVQETRKLLVDKKYEGYSMKLLEDSCNNLDSRERKSALENH